MRSEKSLSVAAGAHPRVRPSAWSCVLSRAVADPTAQQRLLLAEPDRRALNCRRSIEKGSADVATGTVKWFNAAKGYGFIQPDGGGKDVFVHISAVEKAGLSSLHEGAKGSYDIISDRGKESAGNLKVK